MRQVCIGRHATDFDQELWSDNRPDADETLSIATGWGLFVAINEQEALAKMIEDFKSESLQVMKDMGFSDVQLVSSDYDLRSIRLAFSCVNEDGETVREAAVAHYTIVSETV